MLCCDWSRTVQSIATNCCKRSYQIPLLRNGMWPRETSRNWACEGNDLRKNWPRVFSQCCQLLRKSKHLPSCKSIHHWNVAMSVTTASLVSSNPPLGLKKCYTLPNYYILSALPPVSSPLASLPLKITAFWTRLGAAMHPARIVRARCRVKVALRHNTLYYTCVGWYGKAGLFRRRGYSDGGAIPTKWNSASCSLHKEKGSEFFFSTIL